MEYRSPLQDEYQEPNTYGPLHSRTLSGGRYAPYTPRRIKQETDTTSSSQGSHSSHHNSMQRKYTDQYKSGDYPKELSAMIGASECKLCSVELKSPIVAKMHYSGKPHEKKVKSYLIKWNQRTGLPIPDVKVNNSVSKNIFPEYCDVCNVDTKSANDQLLHYCGKKHRKNMLDPANAKKKKKAYETVDLSGRFGIGTNFSSNVSETKNENEIQVADLKKPFTCEPCDVTADIQGQLDQHLLGKKHKEKLEKKNLKIEKKDNPWICTYCNVSLETKGLYSLHINGKRHAKNIKKTKINGKDYCEVCDVSFTSFEHYQAHMAGKKHEKRCNLKALDQKSTVTCQFCPFVGNIENHNCDKSLTKIDFENLENKWVCRVCHNMVFVSEIEYNEHKSSNRHILCMLNQEKGDPINKDLEHFYCILCKKQYQDYKEYVDHLFNAKHMRLSQDKSDVASNLQMFQCTVCNLTLTGQLKDQHLRGRQHIRETWKNDVMHILTELANKDIISLNYRCDNCYVGPLNFKQYSQHLLGEDHINVMIDAKLSSMKHS